MPESLPELAMTLSRVGYAPVTAEPAELSVTLGTFGISKSEAQGHFRFSAPTGWRVRQHGPGEWRIRPARLRLDEPAVLRLERVGPDDERHEWRRAVTVRLDLTTTFDPVRHAFPLRNKASVLGDVLPQWERFRETYRFLPGPLAKTLYRGLYRQIVFLTSEGERRGGLCSGMARWSIARCNGDESRPEDDVAAVDRVALIHGRQLTDRALLASFIWFLRGSPRAAYRAVRRDALRYGETRRALDVAVPKPWRRDVYPAVVEQGHTVVPWRIVQEGPDTARVDVYDPNFPAENGEPVVQSIYFDLAANTYTYRSLVEAGDTNVGMIAVPQAAYSHRGTAILASLGSLLMLPFQRSRS
jgi:hypothetical protein